MKLYLDDIRPAPEGWVLARDYWEFRKIIVEHGLPEEISFDHDLAGPHYALRTSEEIEEYGGDEWRELTGYDCAKMLVDHCKFHHLPLPKWSVHSMNPVGRQNIEALLNKYE